MTLALAAPGHMAIQTMAHQPNSTDHGVRESTFHTLWSGDVDNSSGGAANTTYGTEHGRPHGHTNGTATTSRNQSQQAIERLANGTDIPLDSPPQAVERWNRGDLASFPDTNASTSYYPPDANLTNGTLIRDGYVEVFAVQPSTRARLTPDQHPHYVAPNGSVLATVDYRLLLDGATKAASVPHDIATVRLYVDGELETVIENGSHTPTVPYSALADYLGQNHTLTIEAEIVAGPDRVTVQDTLNVTEYDLTISGFQARYPNGDVGLVTYKSAPWLGYQFPGGTVRGVWRFYSARDEQWDTLVRSTDSNETRQHSPLHPLQVYAYPIETGPTPSPRGAVTIESTYGDTLQPPTLPAQVNLDVVTESYVASFGLVTRIRGPGQFSLTDVHAEGLVRGVSAEAQQYRFPSVPVNRSELQLDVVNRSDDTVTVRVTLHDANTSRPIATTNRAGYVVLDGRRLNTSANGTATVRVPRRAGTLSARYVPGRWWRYDHGYVASSESMYIGGTVIHLVRILYQVSVPVSLFLFGVFAIDRFTGWGVWPPWRGLS